jgi:DNA-binding response OmpR family regulator
MRRVLVVDDEPHIRAVLRGYLEADGFAVSEAADGEEAVRRVRQDAPDLVLLDVMLPGIDGIEALRQVRTFSDVYVIVVTARTEEVDKLVGLGVGADDYVTKPFSPREVAARARLTSRPRRSSSARCAASSGTAPRQPKCTIHKSDLVTKREAGIHPTGSISPITRGRNKVDRLGAHECRSSITCGASLRCPLFLE